METPPHNLLYFVSVYFVNFTLWLCNNLKFLSILNTQNASLTLSDN